MFFYLLLMKITSRLFLAMVIHLFTLRQELRSTRNSFSYTEEESRGSKNYTKKIKYEGLINLRVRLYVLSGCIANLCRTEYLLLVFCYFRYYMENSFK